MEVIVEEDFFAEPVHEIVTDFPFGKKHFVDDMGEDLQSFFRHGFGGPSAGISSGVERGSGPGVRDLGEEPVPDGIELGKDTPPVIKYIKH